MKRWTLPQFEVDIYFTTDWREVKNPAVRYKFERDAGVDPDNGGVCLSDHKGNIYIWIRDSGEGDVCEYADYCAHEATHAVGYIYKYISDKTQVKEIGEVPAYLTGWLTGELLKELGY